MLSAGGLPTQVVVCDLKAMKRAVVLREVHYMSDSGAELSPSSVTCFPLPKVSGFHSSVLHVGLTFRLDQPQLNSLAKRGVVT